MAINPNDFIFHSDYTVNGLLSSYQETLTTPGVQIAPNASMTIYGDYHDIGNARSTPIAFGLYLVYHKYILVSQQAIYNLGL